MRAFFYWNWLELLVVLLVVVFLTVLGVAMHLDNQERRAACERMWTFGTQRVRLDQRHPHL